MSSKRIIEDLLSVLDRGYAPYTGNVDGHVYRRHCCPRPERATWFARRGKYICLGCACRCVQADPVGFQAQLPGVRRGFQVAFALMPLVSVDDLLRAKALLTVGEAAFILNVGKSRVYEMIRSGMLDRHPDEPVRVTSESLRQELRRVAE